MILMRSIRYHAHSFINSIYYMLMPERVAMKKYYKSRVHVVTPNMTTPTPLCGLESNVDITKLVNHVDKRVNCAVCKILMRRCNVSESIDNEKTTLYICAINKERPNDGEQVIVILDGYLYRAKYEIINGDECFTIATLGSILFMDAHGWYREN